MKNVVREFLERKTFALPAGLPIRFDEVKGRLDDKDKAKALRGRRWCEILTENDVGALALPHAGRERCARPAGQPIVGISWES